MSVVQPRVAGVVEPTSDFVLLDGGKRLAYDAKTQSGGRTGLGILLACVFAFSGIISLLVALLGLTSVSTTERFRNEDFTLGLYALGSTAVCVTGFFYMLGWMKRPTIRRLVFDEKSISFDGNSYLLDHVTAIGYRSRSGVSGGGSGWHGTAAMGASQLAYTLSGQVYMQYGADEIAIIKGLHPDNTATVYNQIIGFLAKFGRHYGE